MGNYFLLVEIKPRNEANKAYIIIDSNGCRKSFYPFFVISLDKISVIKAIFDDSPFHLYG